MKKNKIIISALFMFLPVISYAQIFQGADSVRDLSQVALKIVNYLMQTIFALISLGIIYTAFRYINALRQGDKNAVEYRKILVGAIIGLAIAFSLWGIITIISNTMGWGNVGIPELTAPNVR